MGKALLAVVAAALVAAPAAAAGTAVKTAPNAHLKGKAILVDAKGRSLYYYASDQKGQTPTCVNDPSYHCSKVWPPLLTSGTPKAGMGAKQSLLGSVKRPEGTMQVTYAGWPLYLFKGGGASGLPGDKPGDVNGQTFFGVWYVLTPAGKPITAKATP
jgi:predicted lipoprotein with Yx(FWY)xxD motif